MNLDKKTISNLYKKRLKKSPNQDAIGWIENSTNVRYLSFESYNEKISTLANGLFSLGLEFQDKVAILAQTSVEWHLSDLSLLLSGAVVVPIYHTYTSEEVKFILEHSEAKILFVENSYQFKKYIEVQDELPLIKTIVYFNSPNSDLLDEVKDGVRTISFEDLSAYGKDYRKEHGNLFEDAMERINEKDLASIIYTSGTTGVPKGAVITHLAFTQMLLNIHQRLGSVITNAKLLTFLPLSHVLGRCDSLLPLAMGTTNVYAESIDKIVSNLALVKPNIMIAVPRIFEKVYAGILETIEKSGPVTKKLFTWAKEVSDAYFEKIQNDKSPSTREIIERKLAYKLVFSKIYKKFGGEIMFFVSGGAPLAPEIITFLQNANLTILEGYGLTETIAPCMLNPLSKQIPGTVGTPLGDVQIGFANDGEILIKTDALFSEYYKNADATKESFDGQWFRSGDIGELTPEGYLKITDRKKDIIITSGGKNVAPQKIENMMKTRPFISDFMVIGDKRKFLSAIVAIDKNDFLDKLDEFGLSRSCDLAEIAGHPAVKQLIDAQIQAVNLNLAQYETIKTFYISPISFSIENGLITPSLKLRKKEILKKFSNKIDAMYQ